MKSIIARSIATVAVGSLLAVASGGVASASVADGHGSTSTQAAAAQVLQLRDGLTKVAYAGDVAATRGTLDKLNPMLADLAAGKRYSIQAEQQNTASVAAGQGTETSRVLADPSVTPRQLPPVPALPKLPPPLDIVSNLLTNLLTTVTSLLSGLLGGGLPPLPVPGVPGVPTPGLPVPLPKP